MRNRKLGSVLGLLFAAALVGSQAGTAGAAGPVRFGSKLTNRDGSVVQPANAPRECDNTGPNEGDPCTIVSMRAKGFNVGTKERAPKDGRIRKVRLVAHGPGSFRLFFAKAKPALQQARVVKRGPLISFNGDNNDPYTIEVKNVNITVKKGWYIAVRASSFETVTCTSGGPRMQRGARGRNRASRPADGHALTPGLSVSFGGLPTGREWLIPTVLHTMRSAQTA
jgi:hypothetical protein